MENYPSADDAIRRRPTGGPVTLTASVPVMTMTTPYRPHLAPGWTPGYHDHGLHGHHHARDRHAVEVSGCSSPAPCRG